MKITLCRGCVLGQSGFGRVLSLALTEAGIAAEVAGADCMSGCARASTLAFRATGKTAYLFGDLVAGDLDDLVRFALAYDRSADGRFADARPFGALRHKALARIPA
jgi:predicted metal-binding protein